ncbi:hypothetical protein AOLI_G00211450 [Acnodon oligacanthus]
MPLRTAWLTVRKWNDASNLLMNPAVDSAHLEPILSRRESKQGGGFGHDKIVNTNSWRFYRPNSHSLGQNPGEIHHEGLDNTSTRLTRVEQGLKAVQSEQKELKETLGSLVDKVLVHDLRIDSLDMSVREMEKAIAALRQKIDDLDGHSQCYCIRVVRNPEGAETSRPIESTADLISALLGEENYNMPSLMDRAHSDSC